MPVRGNFSKTLVRYDFQPVSRPPQKGELTDSAMMCGDEVARHVEDLDERLAVLDADVHMQPEDHVGARDDLRRSSRIFSSSARSGRRRDVVPSG